MTEQTVGGRVILTRTLVLSSVQADGLLRAATLFDMADSVGHSDKAMRDCLSRMVKEGLLEPLAGRGRSATFRSTDAGGALLEVDVAWTAFAHRLDAGLHPWDGQWHIVGFEIPEQRRGARDALRTLLVEIGASPLQSGLYVHPYDLRGIVGQLADHMGVAEHLTSLATSRLDAGGARSHAELVARLYPVAEIGDRYGALIPRLDAITQAAGDGDDAVLAADMWSAMVDTEAVLRDDPQLPLELLPPDWVGTRARRSFMAAHRATAERSEVFRESRMMQTFSTEIDRALMETEAEFWGRWFPLLREAYRSRLPPAAMS